MSGTASAAPEAPEATGERYVEDVAHGDIARKSGRGAAVALVARLGNLFLTLLSQAVLGRLLPPSEYGVYAMGMTALTFLLLFREFGLQAAGVQKDKLSYREANFLFWANLALITVLGVIGLSAAPLVASFYGVPQVQLVLSGLVIAAMLGGMSAQHTMILRRQLRFTIIAMVDVISLACGIVVGVTVGILRHDIWALLSLYLTQQLVLTLLTVLLTRWIPGRFDLHRGHGAMLKFGAGVTAANILYFITNNISTILIGKYLGAALLGHFNRAQQLYSIPATVLFSSVYLVVFASLSRLYPKPEDYRQFYLATLRRVSVFYMVLSGLLIVAGDNVIYVLIGPKWDIAGHVLQIMALGLVGSGAAQMCGMLYQTQNRLGEFQLWGVIDMILRVGSILIAAQWGIYGFAAGFAISTTLITSPISMWYAGRKGPVGLRDQGMAVRGSILLFFIAAGGTYLAKLALPEGTPALLALIAEGVGCLIAIGLIGFAIPLTRKPLLELVSDGIALLPPRIRGRFARA